MVIASDECVRISDTLTADVFMSRPVKLPEKFRVVPPTIGKSTALAVLKNAQSFGSIILFAWRVRLALLACHWPDPRL